MQVICSCYQNARRNGLALPYKEELDVLRLIQAATDLKYDLMDRAYDDCVWRLQKEVLEDALFSYGMGWTLSTITALRMSYHHPP